MSKWREDDWSPYLNAILEEEGLGPTHCPHCGSNPTEIRCLDCVSSTRYCRTCARLQHRANPLHRIEAWTGTTWIPSWLWQLGAVICLGHHGGPCPSYNASLDDLEQRMLRLTGMRKPDFAKLAEDPTYGFLIGGMGADLVMTIVHTNGFHQLPLYSCQCPNSPSKDIQLLRSGLYPSTPTDTKTVFSLQLLKHFHLMLVDGHISVEKYMGILSRLTNYIFPKTVPVGDLHLVLETRGDQLTIYLQDRTREITRVWQQYGYVTTLKRHGFGVCPSMVRPPGKGELALFCAVCPQPGINLPADWRERAFA